MSIAQYGVLNIAKMKHAMLRTYRTLPAEFSCRDLDEYYGHRNREPGTRPFRSECNLIRLPLTSLSNILVSYFLVSSFSTFVNLSLFCAPNSLATLLCLSCSSSVPSLA